LLIGLGLLLAAALVGLTPLQEPVVQAILLGPDSLVPASAPRTLTVMRHGRRVVVLVRHGIVRMHLAFRSPALGGRSDQYDLYLPPGYDDPADCARRYPVLYLLHGSPGWPDDWIEGMHVAQMEDQDVATGALPPMIMVMPEGNGGMWRDSQYVNTAGGFRAEDLIAHDVVRYVDSHYRTITDRRARAIAGISEGGYGAMNLGLKHRDEFGTIVSIAGYFTANPGEVFMDNNPWGHDRALMEANSPLHYVRRLAGLRDTNILIMDNPDDGSGIRAARRFSRALARWHIAHKLLVQPAPNPLVAHFWPYWRAAFPTALAYIGRHFPARHPPPGDSSCVLRHPRLSHARLRSRAR
jgi:enterochelin esterase-like enzyme